MSLLDSPTPTTFRYQMGANPGINAEANTGEYAEYWRVRRPLVGDKVIEMKPSLPLRLAPSTGLFLADYVQRSSLYLYMQTVIRGNAILEVNDLADPLSIGISLVECESAVTEQNVIDTAVGTLILQSQSGPLEYFDNATPAGLLVQGRSEERR